MIYNGHGGNAASVAHIIQKINQTTPATAFNLGNIDVPDDGAEEEIPFDWHAGEIETSIMLYLTPNLVDMSLAEKPVLTFPPIVQKVQDSGDPSLQGVMMGEPFPSQGRGQEIELAGDVQYRRLHVRRSQESDRGARPAPCRTVQT
jgi:creatinine amidohydrolase/Fe(II)-dependent formamide hydrolase-like protein